MGEAKFIRLRLLYPLDRSVQRQRSIARLCYHERYAYFTYQWSIRRDNKNSYIVIKNYFVTIFKFYSFNGTRFVIKFISRRNVSKLMGIVIIFLLNVLRVHLRFMRITSSPYYPTVYSNGRNSFGDRSRQITLQQIRTGPSGPVTITQHRLGGSVHHRSLLP